MYDREQMKVALGKLSWTKVVTLLAASTAPDSEVYDRLVEDIIIWLDKNHCETATSAKSTVSIHQLLFSPRRCRNSSVSEWYQVWRTVILTRIGRIIVCAILLDIGFSGAMAAQSWVEERNYVSKQVSIYRVDGLFMGKVKGPIGDFAWIQTDRVYSQAYAGPSITLKTWLMIAAGIGAEQSRHPGRLGSFLWAGNDRATM